MPGTGIAGGAVEQTVAADEGPLVDLLCRAFQDDAMAAWIFPDPERRRAILPPFFRVFYRASAACGGAYTDPARTAVVLSLPPGADEPPGLADALLTAAGEYGPALAAVTRAQAEHRPTRPHHYFSFGATAARVRGTGVASAMFAILLDRCDRAGTGGYLEASSPAGRGIARRYGFTDLGDEIRVPGGPALRPMWREPHAPH